jgi:hypothetical protein
MLFIHLLITFKQSSAFTKKTCDMSISTLGPLRAGARDGMGNGVGKADGRRAAGCSGRGGERESAGIALPRKPGGEAKKGAGKGRAGNGKKAGRRTGQKPYCRG